MKRKRPVWTGFGTSGAVEMQTPTRVRAALRVGDAGCRAESCGAVAQADLRVGVCISTAPDRHSAQTTGRPPCVRQPCLSSGLDPDPIGGASSPLYAVAG